MDRSMVIDFNRAYSMEATPEERQLVTDLLTVWGKFEAAAGKNPALIRKGILYEMALQKLIAAGEVSVRPLRGKRQEPKPEGQAEKAARAAIRPEQLPEPGLKDHASPREYAAPLINYAVKTMQQRNANLSAALAAERKEKEKLIAATAKDREIYSFLKENPEAFRAVLAELEQEREARAADQKEHAKLLNAVRAFFRKNIPKNSKDRTPERLGALLDFPELRKDIQIDLKQNTRQQQGTERTL